MLFCCLPRGVFVTGPLEIILGAVPDTLVVENLLYFVRHTVVDDDHR